MEDLVSSSSSFRSVLSCSEGHAQSAESSWTDYFVDFVMSEEEKRQLQDASYCATEGFSRGDGGDHEEEEEEDSMVSDAASRAPAALLPGSYKELKKLKKKVFKALDHDDCFEDTASSPVNSPKVSVVSQMELSPKGRCKIRDLAKEDGIGHGKDHRAEGMDCTDATMEGVGFVDPGDRSITPCAELKDKGICLVPLSMLLDYHGRN